MARELERCGVATVALSLLHTAGGEEPAPRTLWAPFLHGYALGPPDEPRAQRAVLEAALALLEDDSLSPPAWRDCPLKP